MRPAKRVVFDRSDYDNLLDQIVSQINDKRTKDFNDKVEQRMTEEEDLRLNRKALIDEIHHHNNDVSHKRDAFNQANGILKKEKLEKLEEQLRLESLEKVNFFPFVHGDLIERQRNVLTDIIKNEQYQAVVDKNDQLIQKKRDRNQARLNREANNSFLNQYQSAQVSQKRSKAHSPVETLAQNSCILVPKTRFARKEETSPIDSGRAEVI